MTDLAHLGAGVLRRAGRVIDRIAGLMPGAGEMEIARIAVSTSQARLEESRRLLAASEDLLRRTQGERGAAWAERDALRVEGARAVLERAAAGLRSAARFVSLKGGGRDLREALLADAEVCAALLEARKLEPYRVEIDESDRQMILMALADEQRLCPGFDYAIGLVARKFPGGPEMLASFLELNRSIPTKLSAAPEADAPR